MFKSCLDYSKLLLQKIVIDLRLLGLVWANCHDLVWFVLLLLLIRG